RTHADRAVGRGQHVAGHRAAALAWPVAGAGRRAVRHHRGHGSHCAVADGGQRRADGARRGVRARRSTTARASDPPDREPAGDAAVARRLWDGAPWAETAERLRADMARLVGPLENGDTDALAEGFVVSASVLRHFQADPLLPEELLPASWPGKAVRTDYDRFD